MYYVTIPKEYTNGDVPSTVSAPRNYSPLWAVALGSAVFLACLAVTQHPSSGLHARPPPNALPKSIPVHAPHQPQGLVSRRLARPSGKSVSLRAAKADPGLLAEDRDAKDAMQLMTNQVPASSAAEKLQGGERDEFWAPKNPAPDMDLNNPLSGSPQMVAWNAAYVSDPIAGDADQARGTSASADPSKASPGYGRGAAISVAAAAATAAAAAAARAARGAHPAHGADADTEVDGADEEDGDAAEAKGTDGCTLFVGKCPPGLFEQHLRYYWRELGQDAIVAVRLVQKEGSTPNFAFIDFRTPLLAQAAAAYAPLRYQGTQCTHRLADVVKPDVDAELALRENRTVFHGRCPDNITDDHVWRHYASLGEDAIVRISWATNSSGEFRGFGFVEFKTVELARTAANMPPLRVGRKTVSISHGNVGAKAGVSIREAREHARQLIFQHASKRRQSPNQRNRLDDLDDLVGPDWTMEQLEAAPLTKDFSCLVKYSPHTEDEVSVFMEENNIRMEGADARPIMEFSEVEFGTGIDDYLKHTFEIPSPIQRIAWPVVLSGRDVIGLAQTGSGKTLGFGLPAIAHVKASPPAKLGEGPVALIVAPTRELVLQSYRELEKFEAAAGIQVGVAYGGQDGGANKYSQGTKLVSGCDIVVATPGRLLDFFEAGVIPLDRVSFLVLDEADQMLDFGFEPQIRAIIRQLRPDRQTLMFSATWAKEVQQLARQFLMKPVKIIVNNAEGLHANTDITQRFIFPQGGRGERERLLIDVIRDVKAQCPDYSKTLVFVETKSYVDLVVEGLRQHHPNVYGIHGDIPQGARERSLLNLRQDPHGILVATDVVSRGLDIKDLACVVNFEMPSDVQRYIHRIGRTGRAGKEGLAISFMTTKDGALAPDLVRTLREARQEVPPQLEALAQRLTSGGRAGSGGRGARSNSPPRRGSSPGGKGKGMRRVDAYRSDDDFAPRGGGGGGGGYRSRSSPGYDGPSSPYAPTPGGAGGRGRRPRNTLFDAW